MKYEDMLIIGISEDDEPYYINAIEETNRFLPDDIKTKKDLDIWLNMVKKSCFFVYDNTENRNDNAKRYIHNILKKAGYKTDIKEYEVDYHRAIGKDCVEVYVSGDFNVKSFQGKTPEYEKFLYINRNNNKNKRG